MRAGMRSRANKAAGLLRNRPRVVFVGIGGSRYAGMSAALLLSDAAADARVVDGSEALYYERIPYDSAVVLVSRSASTRRAISPRPSKWPRHESVRRTKR
jgi:fructoselysine-6-P-deglycase FrlB-like protein